MTQESNMDPNSLVARIIAELQENPDAQRPLLQALLTNEFLGMPIRLARIEQDIAELKADVSQLKTDVAGLKTDVAELKTSVARLEIQMGQVRGSHLEIEAQRRMLPILAQQLGLRRARTVHSLTSQLSGEYLERLYNAEEVGHIPDLATEDVRNTDVIMHAIRSADRQPVWIIVEVSATIDQHDIARARERADLVAAAYSQEAMAVVAGELIHSADRQRADDNAVAVIII